MRRINPFYLPPSDALETVAVLRHLSMIMQMCFQRGKMNDNNKTILLYGNSFGKTQSSNRILTSHLYPRAVPGMRERERESLFF